MQHGVVLLRDRVENAAVKSERGADAGTHPRIEHGDARLRRPVHLPRHRLRGDQGRADPRICAPGAPAPLQQRPVHTVGGEQVAGQVDAAPVEVLAHVPQEVGELERLPERRRVRFSLLPGRDRAENRQHLQPDHRGRTVYVAPQVGVGGIVRDGQIGTHRGQEVGEENRLDGVPGGGVGDGPDHRFGAATGTQPARQVALQSAQMPVALLGRSVPIEVVHDVVGPAGEAVQGVHGGAAFERQQAGGQEVGLAVTRVEPSATGVGGAERGIGDSGRVEFTTAHRHLPGPGREWETGRPRSAAGARVRSASRCRR